MHYKSHCQESQFHRSTLKESLPGVTVTVLFQVDAKSAGKTALQLASHQGSLEMVSLLLKAGADIEIKDDDGDTALHYSAFG